MSFLRAALDDPETGDCGNCVNCLAMPLFSSDVDHELSVQAAYYLRHAEIPIKLLLPQHLPEAE